MRNALRNALTSLILTLPLLAQPATVRQLYIASDEDAAIRTYRALPSPAIEDRAFAVAAYARSGRPSAAKRELEILQAQEPQNPWTWYAAAMLADETDARAGLQASERMIALAGPAPDEEMIRLYASHLLESRTSEEALAFLARWPQTLRLRAMRASALSQRPDDHEAVALFESLRREAPDFLNAWLAPGQMSLGQRRYAEALPLLKQAAALSSSPRVHSSYWRALAATPDLTDEQKKAERDAYIAALCARRGEVPELWLALASEYARAGDAAAAAELNERVIREVPNSIYAARAMWARYGPVSKKYGAEGRTDPQKRAELKKLVRDYLDYKTDEEDFYRVNAYAALWALVKNDDAATPDEIIEAAQGVRPEAEWNPGIAADIATLLATRRIRLDLAEEIAHAGIDQVKRFAAGPDGANAEYTDMLRAWVHDSLGWVLLQKGDTAAARTQLLAAYELHPDSARTLFHLGRLYEAQAPAKAEQFYRRGASIQSSDETNPNDEALESLYRKQHGTTAGYEAWRKSSEKGEVAARRIKVLEERRKTPPPARDFHLKTLDGREVSLASLKGKAAVINFWGIWCGWCVKEMPEYHQLAKKYAKDPSVAVLTINNDGDAAGVRKWMAEKNYDFAVLLDDGFVRRTEIHGFPTTWFLDRTGRIAFEKQGWTKRLLEEFSWRIEDLKK